MAWIVFTLSGAYLLRRRRRLAFIVGLGALFFLGALMVQVRGPDCAGNTSWTRFADRTEAITAQVTKEGTLQDDSPVIVRQRIEAETEQITKDAENFAVNSRLRINVYQQRFKSGKQAARPSACFATESACASPPRFLCRAITAPLMELLMPAAVAAMALGYVSQALARIPVLMAGAALEGIAGAVRWLGDCGPPIGACPRREPP